MVDEGPWEPIEDESDDDDDEAPPEKQRGFWDYALIGVVVVIVVVFVLALVSSQSASKSWSLDVRGELGEHDEAVHITENNTVVFDAAVGFAGGANGDVAENVQVRAIADNGTTVGRQCLGTLTNDADHEYQPFQFDLRQEPNRVVIELTAVQSGGDYLVRGWSHTGGMMGGNSMLVENQSTYINESACSA